MSLLELIFDDAQSTVAREQLVGLLTKFAKGLTAVDLDRVADSIIQGRFQNMQEKDILDMAYLNAKPLNKDHYHYSYFCARILIQETVMKDVRDILNLPNAPDSELLVPGLRHGRRCGMIDERLLDGRFDLEWLAAALKPKRNELLTVLAAQTLYDRYLQHDGGVRYETIQTMFMRIAMGLAIDEDNPTQRALEFYELLSCFDYMSSTPTLFNAGTKRPQLSSCYLTTIQDDLYNIYGGIRNNAMLSKWSGGIGNDWSRVRALNAHIKGTNGKSQGTVPFLKVNNDTAVAVNQCFAPETTLYVRGAVKAISDVQVGDLVLGVSGTYREVLDVMRYDQTDAMVELRVKHGEAPVKVTAGHPFFTLRGFKKGGRYNADHVKTAWVEAKDLTADDMIAQVIPKEVITPTGYGIADYLVYGILLGDGYCTVRSNEWGVSGNTLNDEHMQIVTEYLNSKNIHYWVTDELGGSSIRWSKNDNVFPFKREHLYDADGNKCIHSDFTHTLLEYSSYILKGLLITDGNISRGKELTFSTTSVPLMRSLRYQLLRHGIPTSVYTRTRVMSHDVNKASGKVTAMDCTSTENVVRIPSTGFIPRMLNVQPITKMNWVIIGNHLFSRVKSVNVIENVPEVYDLIVEGDESYMLTSGLAHNGGKRKGAFCAYLTTWHLDIEEFLELRKNTGDDRRRTHDMNTANWIPDLFMQRMLLDQDWTLFSPNEVPELNETYGAEFEKHYTYYEENAKALNLLHKRVKAKDLWRKMLTMLFETGHPWVTFKDPCNIRSPQSHVGIVRSSNLCTEITLNTSDDEIAVCNLGSVNLVNHIVDGMLDAEKLERTIKTAIRMLDNVISINYYPVEEAENSNLKHRPIGLGIMGFQDALYKLGHSYASQAAVNFADESMELISYYAIKASANLARERGSYPTFEGSTWSKGQVPLDTLDALIASRPQGMIEVDTSSRLGKERWDEIRELVRGGMRNSNVMAIAPTATISNICGVSQSIEPTFQNLFVKSNLSGEFTVNNPYLVDKLIELGLWDLSMSKAILNAEGSIQKIPNIPADVKEMFLTAFEVEPRWIVDAASRRQKWVDQAQSLNLYIANANGKKLDLTYKMAWLRGLKTTYYLRAIGATSAEKSTGDTHLNAVSATIPEFSVAAPVPRACAIDSPDCEACQ